MRSSEFWILCLLCCERASASCKLRSSCIKLFHAGTHAVNFTVFFFIYTLALGSNIQWGQLSPSIGLPSLLAALSNIRRCVHLQKKILSAHVMEWEIIIVGGGQTVPVYNYNFFIETRVRVSVTHSWICDGMFWLKAPISNAGWRHAPV